jgi:ribosomal protein S18 acetylase RimI-like enzyme
LTIDSPSKRLKKEIINQKVSWVTVNKKNKNKTKVLGKVEGREKNWHGHVTAVTVGPDFRRIGNAKKLMDLLETISESIHDAYFVDLFVRSSNKIAIQMFF